MHLKNANTVHSQIIYCRLFTSNFIPQIYIERKTESKSMSTTWRYNINNVSLIYYNSECPAEI